MSCCLTVGYVTLLHFWLLFLAFSHFGVAPDTNLWLEKRPRSQLYHKAISKNDLIFSFRCISQVASQSSFKC